MYLVHSTYGIFVPEAMKDGKIVKPAVARSRCAWAGGTFFLVVLLCQFLVLAGNRFWFYILRMHLEYKTVVVLC